MGEILRRDGESLFEFKIRLCNAKLNKEIDLDWVELVDILGLDCSSDHLRKLSYGYKEFSEYMNIKQIENVSENEILKKIEDKTRELERERIKIRTEKIELNRYKNIDVRNEMLYEEFKKSVTNTTVPNFKPILNINGNKIGHLGISDFHFGKHFSILNNEYNEQIFYNRMNQIANDTIEICKELGITKLHVLNCGDDVEGMTLRVSQVKSLQFGFTDQVIKVAKYMVKFLSRLSEELEVVYHHVLEGNHSEIRAFSDKTWTLENMERIIITYIRDMTENNPRIVVPEYSGQYVQYDILGYKIYARHGHRKMNENKVIGDVTMQLRKFIDYVYFGHLHHHKRKTVSTGTTNNKEVIYLPSIMGEDEYSQDFMFGGAKASAILDIYEENKGIKCSYNILAN